MQKFAKEIIIDFDNHLSKSYKKSYSDFYIGITNNIDRRLFSEHNVPRHWHWYIYHEAINEENARLVENHYLKKWMQWGGWWGNGDWTAIFVYCYYITSYTNQ